MGMTAVHAGEAKKYLVFRVHLAVPPQTEMLSCARGLPPTIAKKQLTILVAGRVQESEESETKLHGVAWLLQFPVKETRTIEVAARLWTPMTLLKKPADGELILLASEKKKLWHPVVFVVCVVWMMGKSGGPKLLPVKNQILDSIGKRRAQLLVDGQDHQPLPCSE